MEAQIIEKLGYAGITLVLSLALLKIIKEQLRDLKNEVRMNIQTTLKADQQMRTEIYRHGERIRQCENSIKDLSNIMNLKRRRDYKGDQP